MKKELRSLYKKGNEIKPMIENIQDELINEKTNKQGVKTRANIRWVLEDKNAQKLF